MNADRRTAYRFEVGPLNPADPRSAGYRADAHALGLTKVSRISCRDLYFIQGELSPADLERLAHEILADPVAESVAWQPVLEEPPSQPLSGRQRVEVALRPGVTDPVAEQIVRAAHEIGIAGLENASTGLQFTIEGQDLAPADLHLLARRLLANAVVQRYALGEIEPAFPVAAQASGQVERISIRSLDDAALLALSQAHRAALDLNEMHAIQRYFQSENRDCTDVEFEMIAQTWSEHCVHKTLKARVTVEQPASASAEAHALPYPPVVDNILKTYIRAATEQIQAPWIISAFVDNAGIIEFDGENEVSFKVETHNHPSAIEPFGGANTGVGGVIRDVMGVSAKPIANTDVLCFGPQDYPIEKLPEGVLHPRRIFSGVVAGVQDYGNKMGIPTVNGAIWFDEGFISNPLVFCGCVGIAPKGKHCRTPRPGDRVIVLGGRTGRDGLRGATFSSQTMDAQTGEVAGASVQIGAPITEKGVIEVILQARDQGLYTAITDCGAGGLSSAVGEMASVSGADVDLTQVRLKYPGLAPWEIWLSEAQERMVLAVPPEHLPALQSMCDIYEVELTDIGAFTGDHRTVVRHAGQVVLDLDNAFLHDGLPQRHLKAVIPAVLHTAPNPPIPNRPSPSLALLRLLEHPNIASKASVVRIYDHEVLGGTRIKPLAGAGGPSDASVLRPLTGTTIEETAEAVTTQENPFHSGSNDFSRSPLPIPSGTMKPASSAEPGIVLSNGLNPEYGKVDAYRMAVSAIDEAVRNAVAVGANPDRLAILDNFCWGDPLRPEVMGTLLEAARGCYDAALLHRTPFISGKDSFNNEYIGSDGRRHSIPPTLLISAIGVIDDISRTVTMDLKAPENPVYCIGEHHPTFGGSHYTALFGSPAGLDTSVPAPSERAPAVYRALHRAIQLGLVASAHDLSEGGLAVAAAEMCIGGNTGMQVYLPEYEDPSAVLFGESNGCLLVEVPAQRAEEFEALMISPTAGPLPWRRIGRVRPEPELRVVSAGEPVIFLHVDDLARAWNGDSAKGRDDSQEAA
jgi:phosphoribosylformylglycinamidine synthase subunit PurSL